MAECDIDFHDDAFPPAVALADIDRDDLAESGSRLVSDQRMNGKHVASSTRSLPRSDSGRWQVWVPASMLLSGDPRQRVPLFYDIDPGDVRQGAIGDCWLIAAMSCLANYPEEVEALFAPGCRRYGSAAIWESAPDGRYTLQLFEHRRHGFIKVEIDERVPVKKPGPRCYYPGWEHLAAGLPIFAKPSNVEVWPLLLEKAMAKLFGGYRALSGGHESAAFRAFTGCTRQESWKRQRDGAWQRRVLMEDSLSRFIVPRAPCVERSRMWEMLEEWAAKNYLMATAIMTHDAETEHRRPDGLIEQHAYSILMTISVCGFRLVKLRNPWGSDAEWTGDWSDDSDLWARNPSVAEALGFQKAADGIFWMEWRDFSSVFNSLEVSHKSMRTGPGKTRLNIWRDERRCNGVASISRPPNATVQAPQAQEPPARQPSPPALQRMDTDERIAAAIAMSIEDLASAPPPPAYPAPSSSPSLECPLHGQACASGPFAHREELSLHVNVALDQGDAETVDEPRTVIRTRSRYSSFPLPQREGVSI